MAFEKALNYAVKLGGEAFAFQQREGVCLAYVTKWMIDQILGRKFQGRCGTPEVDVRGEVNAIVGDLEEIWFRLSGDEKSRLGKPRVVPRSTEGGRPTTQTKKLWDGLAGHEPRDGLHQSASALKSHLHVKGLPAEVEAVTDAVAGLPVSAIRLKLPPIVCEDFVGGYIISLRTEKSASAGKASYNHTLGAYSYAEDGGKDLVGFFDPNMGEVRVPRGRFADWFGNYRTGWSAHKKMALVDTYYMSSVRGPGDVTGYVKSRFEQMVKAFAPDAKANDFASDDSTSFDSSEAKDVLTATATLSNWSLDDLDLSLPDFGL